MHHSACGPAAWKAQNQKDKGGKKTPAHLQKEELQPWRCRADTGTEEQLGQVEVNVLCGVLSHVARDGCPSSVVMVAGWFGRNQVTDSSGGPRRLRKESIQSDGNTLICWTDSGWALSLANATLSCYAAHILSDSSAMLIQPICTHPTRSFFVQRLSDSASRLYRKARELTRQSADLHLYQPAHFIRAPKGCYDSQGQWENSRAAPNASTNEPSCHSGGLQASLKESRPALWLSAPFIDRRRTFDPPYTEDAWRFSCECFFHILHFHEK